MLLRVSVLKLRSSLHGHRAVLPYPTPRIGIYALIISVPDQRRLEPEVVVVDAGRPFAMGRYKQLRIDYLDAAEPFFKLVVERYSERRRFDFLAGGRPLACATPEGLMLLKLYALRRRSGHKEVMTTSAPVR